MGKLPERTKLHNMNIKKLIKKALVSACVIFTIITAAYMLVLQIINISENSAAVEAGRVLLFFVFSCLLAIANAILSINKIHTALRYIIHYAIFIFAFSVCFCIPNKMNATKIIIGITLATIGYCLVMLLISVFKKRFFKSKAEPEKYEKQFSYQKKKK